MVEIPNNVSIMILTFSFFDLSLKSLRTLCSDAFTINYSGPLMADVAKVGRT